MMRCRRRITLTVMMIKWMVAGGCGGRSAVDNVCWNIYYNITLEISR